MNANLGLKTCRERQKGWIFLRRDRFAAIGAAKQWSSMNFVILDTETTDRGSLAHIVEFSCIDREGNILVDSLVNPGFPIRFSFQSQQHKRHFE